MFTLLLCGCADAQERFDIVDESEVNLRCSCSSSMQNNPFFWLVSKPSNETTVIQLHEISPKNEPFSGPSLH